MREIAEAAWRCADPGVQYDTTINQLAHLPELGPDQRVEPVLGVHARRRLRLQPRLAEPDEVPPRRTAASTSSASSTPSTSSCSPRRSSSGRPATRPRRSAMNARAFRQLGPRLREPRRLPDGGRHALRLRRGPGRRRGDHRADDRPRLPPLGARSPRRSGPTSATRRTGEAHNARHADAPRRLLRDPRATSCADDELLAAAAPLVGGGGRARRGPRLPQRAGDGARPDGHDLVPDGLRHDRRGAGLLAGEVQGAGRRRDDDDRQPHDADRAGDARLLDQQIEQIEAHIDEHGTIVGAPGLDPEHLSDLRRRRRLSARSRTWATSR